MRKSQRASRQRAQLSPGLGNTQHAAAGQVLSWAFREDRWVEAAEDVCIYLNWETLERHQVDRARAENIAAEAAATVPGVLAAYTRTHFLTGTLPDTPLARKAAHSFNPRRSGDVFLG